MELTHEQKIKFITQYVPEGESPKVYWELLKGQIMGTDKQGKPRPDEDLYYFMYVAKRTGLDPMVKQIYPVYRWDYKTGKEKMTIQVGIDGMRLVAERTGLYAGSDDALFDAEDQTHPNKATMVVYKVNKITGERMPITASARWTEYAQTDKEGKIMGLWGKMPYLMLSKCAEALALRKAFPNELSGIYTDEEMAQTANLSSVLDNLPKPNIKKNEVTHETPASEKPIDKQAVEEAKVTIENIPAIEPSGTSGGTVDTVGEPQKITDNIDLGAMREANKTK
jgi:phage recombination protein Bet